MNIIQTAKNKGITVKEDGTNWRIQFGDNVLFNTTKVSSIERFLNECELIVEPNTLALRISGFVEFRIAK